MASSSAPTDAPAQPYLSTMPSESFNWQITLSEKVIAITGANRGIGLGIAEVCLSNAAKTVFSLDITEPGDEFKALAGRFPGRLEYVQTNVADEESVEKSINTIVENSGSIDGLVANAGMTKHQPALQFQRPELQKLFELNVFGAYFCANIVARKFIELGIKGSIVMTSSMTSYRPNRVSPPHIPLKSDIFILTENRPLLPPPMEPQKPPSATFATPSPWNGANTAFASTASHRVSSARP